MLLARAGTGSGKVQSSGPHTSGYEIVVMVDLQCEVECKCNAVESGQLQARKTKTSTDDVAKIADHAISIETGRHVLVWG